MSNNEANAVSALLLALFIGIFIGSWATGDIIEALETECTND